MKLIKFRINPAATTIGLLKSPGINVSKNVMINEINITPIRVNNLFDMR
jgi:hypothetical protein